MDITKLSILELKALAYDTIAIYERAQKDLDTINKLIDKKLLETPILQEEPVAPIEA